MKKIVRPFFRVHLRSLRFVIINTILLHHIFALDDIAFVLKSFNQEQIWRRLQCAHFGKIRNRVHHWSRRRCRVHHFIPIQSSYSVHYDFLGKYLVNCWTT